MNRISYRKGKRQEIMMLLHYCGAIPYSAINFMETSQKSRMYHAVINKMVKEGVVKIVKKNGEKQLVLDNYEAMSPLYTKSLPGEYQNHYLNVGMTLRKMALFQNQDAGKVIRTNETVVLMYSIGAKVLLTDKENIVRSKELPADENMYYTSREVKRGTNYTDLIEMENTQKSVTGSRLDGLYISEGGIYVVYNLRSRNYLWKPQGELRIKMYVERLINTKHPAHATEKDFKCKDAIILAKKQSLFAKMLADEIKNDSFKKMIGLGSLYINIYALPSDANGKKMLEIMSRKNWKQDMLENILPIEALGKNKFTNVPCDGYDKENDVYKLLYCIPNLSKLYSFAERAKIENNPEKFEVYCFDYQTKLVVVMTEGKVKVKQLSLEEYYNYIIKLETNGKIYDDLAGDPFLSSENIAELERRVEEIRNGKSKLAERDLLEVD